MVNNNSEEIVKLLKQGDEAILKKIYEDNRPVFINFAKKFNIETYDAVDIYQDAILALRENAINGKINNLQSSISTYLFAIGKYKIFHLQRKRSKMDFEANTQLIENKTGLDVDFEEEELTNQQILIKKYFIHLGKRCKNVLTLFYYEGYTLDEITDILKYSNKKVLKSQKSRCMKQLRDMVNTL